MNKFFLNPFLIFFICFVGVTFGLFGAFGAIRIMGACLTFFGGLLAGIVIEQEKARELK